jgi:HEAT repeat protein
MQDNSLGNGPGRKYVFEKEGMQGLCEALEDGDYHIRQMAALFLGETAEQRVVANLIRALHDPEKNVRARATDGLVRIGPAAVDSLVHVITSEDWVVRYRAAEALGRIEDERGMTPLVDALHDTKDHVRYMAAKGLGRYADITTLEVLAGLLSDENVFVRRSAALAIGEIGGEKARRALDEACALEPDPDVRDVLRESTNRASRIL